MDSINSASCASEEDSMSSMDSGRIKARLLKVIHATEAVDIETQLDELWASGRFRIRRAPCCGLIMSSVNDPFDTPFYLGEVLVSQAQVDCDGQTGWGAICGDEPQRALLLAAVEAAELRGYASMLEPLCSLLERLEASWNEKVRRISRLAAGTQVQFESMKKEKVDFGSLGD